MKRFCESIPEHYIIIDYTTDVMSKPSYERYNYYYGKRFYVGFFWNAMMDTLFGDLEATLDKVKKVAKEATNCIGFTIHPENEAVNPIYRQFLTELAWQPLKLTLDKFLNEWAWQRYGDASIANMVKAWRKIILAMKYNTIKDRAGWGGPYLPFYRFSGRPSGTKYNREKHQ